MNGKYYVLISNIVGGAEKRFVDVFLSQLNNGMDVSMVLTSQLAEIIFSAADLEKFRQHIIEIKMERWSRLEFLWKYWKWLMFSANRSKTFHYVLTPLFFCHLLPTSRFVASFCDCNTLPCRPWDGVQGFLQWGALLFARKIDVLNPFLFALLRKKYKTTKFSLTPGGTFIRRTKREKNTGTRKGFRVSFISRLEPKKGVELFLEVAERFVAIEPRDIRIEFAVFGDGTLKPFVQSRILDLIDAGLNIKYFGFVPAEEAYIDTSLVCSFQTVTNYPSRVVAEALLSGIDVLVLDSGDSREFGLLPGIHYLPDGPQVVDSAVKFILEIQQQKGSESLEGARKIVADAEKRFQDSSYLDYMMKL